LPQRRASTVSFPTKPSIVRFGFLRLQPSHAVIKRSRGIREREFERGDISGYLGFDGIYDN
jgi:hypothetical protein